MKRGISERAHGPCSTAGAFALGAGEGAFALGAGEGAFALGAEEGAVGGQKEGAELAEGAVGCQKEGAAELAVGAVGAVGCRKGPSSSCRRRRRSESLGNLFLDEAGDLLLWHADEVAQLRLELLGSKGKLSSARMLGIRGRGLGSTQSASEMRTSKSSP